MQLICISLSDIVFLVLGFLYYLGHGLNYVIYQTILFVYVSRDAPKILSFRPQARLCYNYGVAISLDAKVLALLRLLKQRDVCGKCVLKFAPYFRQIHDFQGRLATLLKCWRPHFRSYFDVGRNIQSNGAFCGLALVIVYAVGSLGLVQSLTSTKLSSIVLWPPYKAILVDKV